MVQSRCDSAAALNMMPAAHCKATGFEITQHDLQQALAQQQPQQCPPPTGAPAAGSHDAHAQRMCLNPAEIYDHIADGGQAKHRNSFLKELVLGILAGVFIGFGFATCMIAAGQIPAATRKENPGIFNLLFGAYGFPVGLSMCVINGASLFTSNIAYMMAAFIERRSTGMQALWVVWLSYFSNLVGCLFLVHLMVTGEVFAHREAFTIELALKKTSYSFYATMVKGIMCNWLVCMAVWQGNAAQDVTGKLLGIWFPISAFVTSGYEHSIANMFVIPLAMRLGAPISVHTFVVKNLIPATIGNLIGGAIFVAMAMGMSYGSWEKKINAAGARLYHRVGVLPDCGLAAFGAANAAPACKRSGGGSADASLQSAATDGSGAEVAAQLAVVTPLKSVAAHPAAV